jgi:hypothetical protein
MSIQAFIEEKINVYAQRIVDRGETTDDVAVGELVFYIALRRVLAGKGSKQDLGMMDAVNDVLQEKGIIPEGASFYK